MQHDAAAANECRTEEFRISTATFRGLTTVTEGTRDGHGLKVEEEGHDRQPERRVARCGNWEFTGRPSTFQSVRVIYLITRVQLSTLLPVGYAKNLRNLFLIFFPLCAPISPIFTQFCRAWTKSGCLFVIDVSIFFFFLFFFFFVELFVSLVTSFVDEWMLGLVNIFQKIRLIEYIKSLRSLTRCWIDLLSMRSQRSALWKWISWYNLLLNYISERRRCRWCLFWEIRDNPSFYSRARMQLTTLI